MKVFNDSELEQEFACTLFKTQINANDWTKEQLIELLMQQKKGHMSDINFLLWNLRVHGIIASLVHVENGGSNDVSWDVQYLNEKIKDAHKKHIRPLVGYYLAKALSDAKEA